MLLNMFGLCTHTHIHTHTAAAGVIFGLITFEKQRRNVITVTMAAMVVALMSCSLQYHMLRRFHVPSHQRDMRGIDEKRDGKTET